MTALGSRGHETDLAYPGRFHGLPTRAGGCVRMPGEADEELNRLRESTEGDTGER